MFHTAGKRLFKGIGHTLECVRSFEFVLQVVFLCFCRMSVSDCFAQERIWFDKPRYDEAERQFYERLNGPAQPKQVFVATFQHFTFILYAGHFLYLSKCATHKLHEVPQCNVLDSTCVILHYFIRYVKTFFYEIAK